MKQSVVLLDLQTLSSKTSAETDAFKVKVRTPKRPRKTFPIKETPVPEVSPALKTLIDKNLLEIFKFYCKKHLNQQGDFEQLDYQRNVLAHKGYVNFCKDFKLPISGPNITEVFKKSTVNNQPHEYEHFSNSITNLGMRINKAKAEEKKKKIQEIRYELKKRTESKEAPKKKEKADMDADSTTSPLVQSFKLPDWNPSFKSKFAKKSDD